MGKDRPRPEADVRRPAKFFKPFEAHNTAEFKLAPGGGGTTVTWAMFGPSPYMSKLMGIFFNMERMVGGQFEQGLANLNSISEK